MVKRAIKSGDLFALLKRALHYAVKDKGNYDLFRDILNGQVTHNTVIISTIMGYAFAFKGHGRVLTNGKELFGNADDCPFW